MSINPSDLLDVYIHGDGQTEPGAPTGGPFGEVPETDYHSKLAAQPNIHRVYDLSLAQNAEDRINLYDRPDFWVISNANVANTEVMLWTDEAPIGPAARIGPGGRAVLGGTCNFLYYRQIGSGTAIVTVIAVRGYECPGIDVRWGP